MSALAQGNQVFFHLNLTLFSLLVSCSPAVQAGVDQDEGCEERLLLELEGSIRVFGFVELSKKSLIHLVHLLPTVHHYHHHALEKRREKRVAIPKGGQRAENVTVM